MISELKSHDDRILQSSSEWIFQISQQAIN